MSGFENEDDRSDPWIAILRLADGLEDDELYSVCTHLTGDIEPPARQLDLVESILNHLLGDTRFVDSAEIEVLKAIEFFLFELADARAGCQGLR